MQRPTGGAAASRPRWKRLNRPTRRRCCGSCCYRARRVKARKRAFGGLRARGGASPTFDPDREYTFEFFQHLLLFDEFTLDLPRPVGKRPLRRMLDGQPLKFMAAYQVVRDGAGGIGPTGTKAINEEMRWLWSFDLWHESLYEDAIDRDEECTQCVSREECKQVRYKNIT